MDVLGSKLVSMFVLGFLSVFFGVLPILIQRFCMKGNDDDNETKVKATSKKKSTKVSRKRIWGYYVSWQITAIKALVDPSYCLVVEPK